MKKLLLILTAALLLSHLLLAAPMAHAAEITDADALNTALAAAQGETAITLSGTVAPGSLTFPTGEASVTITGGTLDLSGITALNVGCDLTLESTALILRSGGVIYANGYDFTIKDTVTVTYKDASGNAVESSNISMTVYGGKNGGTLNGNTNLRLESGIYTRVYGGSKGGTVNGSTHVVIGTTGNVNNNTLVGWSDSTHGSAYQFFGGSNNGTVTGDTHITVGGKAYADYVVGGNESGGRIDGTANMYFSGYAYGLYGASRGGNTGNDVNLVMTGGGVCDIFGASNGASLGSDTDKSNVLVTLLGGEVKRRVYGGCYNEADLGILSATWKSSHQVNGTITVVIHSGVTLSLNSDMDRGVFARSRILNVPATEKSVLVISPQTAYNTYKGKLGQLDSVAKRFWTWGGGSVPSAADAIHSVSHSASGSTVTESCNGTSCGAAHTATATLKLDPAASTGYTGNAVEPVTVEYSGSWLSGALTLSYENNVNLGTNTARASVTTYDNVSASINFSITKAAQSAPAVSKVNDETVKGAGDGQISGLSTAMEYSTNGTTYIGITDTGMLFPAGTYAIRYAETDTKLASPATTITINPGRMLTVTFRAEGSADVVREVALNGSLSAADIPPVPTRVGYTQVTPVWDTAFLAKR